MDVRSSINQTALVIAKTKVAPNKRLSIPWFELCGAPLVTKLLLHCGNVLGVPLESIYAWIDKHCSPQLVMRVPRSIQTIHWELSGRNNGRIAIKLLHHIPGS